MYVYTETGILIERIKYTELAKECGKPIGVSHNGRNFIFRKTEGDHKIYLVKMNIDGMKVYKTIDMRKSVEEYVQDMKDDKVSKKEEIKSFVNEFLEELKNFKNIRT